MDPGKRDAELVSIYSAELIEIAHAMEALTVRLNRFRDGLTYEELHRLQRITTASGKVSNAARRMGNDLRSGYTPGKGKA